MIIARFYRNSPYVHTINNKNYQRSQIYVSLVKCAYKISLAFQG